MRSTISSCIFLSFFYLNNYFLFWIHVFWVFHVNACIVFHLVNFTFSKLIKSILDSDPMFKTNEKRKPWTFSLPPAFIISNFSKYMFSSIIQFTNAFSSWQGTIDNYSVKAIFQLDADNISTSWRQYWYYLSLHELAHVGKKTLLKSSCIVSEVFLLLNLFFLFRREKYLSFLQTGLTKPYWLFYHLSSTHR